MLGAGMFFAFEPVGRGTLIAASVAAALVIAACIFLIVRNTANRKAPLALMLFVLAPLAMAAAQTLSQRMPFSFGRWGIAGLVAFSISLLADDRNSLARQAIKKPALADIRSADDCDGAGHEESSG